MKRKSFVFLCLGMVVVHLGCRRPVVIGSKNFTEQVILGEMLALLLEDRGVPVDRKLNLGGSFICHSAIESGEMDVYIEYTGTALTAILKEPVIHDSEEVYRRVRAEYRRRFGLEWGQPLGFNNTYALAMRSDHAAKLGIRRISDLREHLDSIRTGFGHEFLEREDGYRGFTAAYDLEFVIPPSGMELGLIYQALAEEEVDLVAGSSTDALIEKLGLTVLEDDKSFFPPYDAAPVYRPDTAKVYPALTEILAKLGGQIDEDTMRKLNLAVDVERESERGVAAEFLVEKGWIHP
jgi:glycine betaine/choline ABC-type transport system substrate-binding protein